MGTAMLLFARGNYKVHSLLIALLMNCSGFNPKCKNRGNRGNTTIIAAHSAYHEYLPSNQNLSPQQRTTFFHQVTHVSI